MILRGAGAEIEISRGRIESIRKPARTPKGAEVLDLEDRPILPGLINAHDHLEFNLYPRLGHGPYPNAGAWARDVYRPNESPIAEQLRIPKNTRLLWGGLKNLVSGVTTVCHHNPREQPVFDRDFPVRVLKQFGWAHSLEFSPDVRERFERTPSDWPFILHLGEGVDGKAKREIFDLDAMGALDGHTVLTHAVALGARGLRLAKKRGASLIWCPSSNLFLLGRTLTNDMLRSGVPIALGSDSALTAQGDLLDEIQVARRVSRLAAAVIRRMVNTDAARILRLRRGEGALEPGGVADLIAMGSTGPVFVMLGGRLKLISARIAKSARSAHLHRLNVEGRGDFLVDANVPRLRRQVEQVLGREFRLAGRRVLP